MDGVFDEHQRLVGALDFIPSSDLTNVEGQKKDESDTTTNGEDFSDVSFEPRALHESLQFTDSISNAINDVVPSNDPLDQTDFNAMEYVNNLFPDEESLDNVDKILGKLSIKLRRLDGEIVGLVRQQCRAGTKGRQELNEARSTIMELFAKINDIKRKAEQSEVMVQEITRDIKSLDYAKRNLTITVTVLKRLHALVTFVDQLTDMARDRQYNEVAALFEAVTQILGYFSDYTNVPKIDQLNAAVDRIRSGLFDQIVDEFERLDRAGAATNEEKLRDSCYVIAALGEKTKKKFMDWFTSNQLKEYKDTFKPGSENAKLEFTERRYIWLSRKLRHYDEVYQSVFPPEWRMGEAVAQDFCDYTRLDLTEILKRSAADDTLPVAILMRVLQKTVEFEQGLRTRFNQTSKDGTHLVDDDDDDDEDDELSDSEANDEFDAVTHADRNSAAQVKKRRKRQIREARREKRRTEREALAKSADAKKFAHVISSSFEPYMHMYIGEEDKQMRELLERILTEESWSVKDDEGNKVLASGKDLVTYFIASVKRCSALTRGQSLHTLYMKFQENLDKYCEALRDKLDALRGAADPPRLADRESRTALLIVNTAEYLKTTMAQMADAFRKAIDEKYKESIDQEALEEEFGSVIASGVKLLVAGLMTRLDAALQVMMRKPWASWEFVGDQSDYVNQLATYLAQHLPLINTWLSGQHSRFFADSFVSTFIPRLIGAIYKCGRISQTGAEQMLLDMTAVRSSLLEIPKLGLEGDDAVAEVPRRFARYVKKEMGRVDILLKLIITPQESLLASYQALVVKRSERNLVRIMELKGIPKPDQDAIVSEYREMHGSVHEGEPEVESEIGAGALGEEREIDKIAEIGNDMLRKIEGLFS